MHNRRQIKQNEHSEFFDSLQRLEAQYSFLKNLKCATGFTYQVTEVKSFSKWLWWLCLQQLAWLDVQERKGKSEQQERMTEEEKERERRKEKGSLTNTKIQLS